jgi:hypothetical protein
MRIQIRHRPPQLSGSSPSYGPLLVAIILQSSLGDSHGLSSSPSNPKALTPSVPNLRSQVVPTTTPDHHFHPSYLPSQPPSSIGRCPLATAPPQSPLQQPRLPVPVSSQPPSLAHAILIALLSSSHVVSIVPPPQPFSSSHHS